jgi:hypothetical protein
MKDCLRVYRAPLKDQVGESRSDAVQLIVKYTSGAAL